MDKRRRFVLSMGAMALVATALGLPRAYAQTVPEPHLSANPDDYEGDPVRVGFGVGAGMLAGGTEGIALQAAVTLSKRENRALTIRVSGVSEVNLFGPRPDENVWDVGVLFGRQAKGKWAYASASAGLALVGGMRRGERTSPPFECSGDGGLLGCMLEAAFTPVEYAEDPFYTVGIPVELDVGLTFSSRLGLSVTGFADLNPQRTMTGLSVGVVVGRLR